MLLLAKYWKELALLVIVIGCIVYVRYLQISNSYLTSELNLKKQAEKILTDEYIKRSKEADTRNVIVQKDYITKIKKIDHWYTGDKNVTCENAISYIDNYIY
jgi:hypothetical protein